MGRSRKRQRRGIRRRFGRPRAATKPGFAPPYVSVRSESDRAEQAVRVLTAPVLPLDGLDPWADIPGPALLLEEPQEAPETGLTFTHPDQLELSACAVGRDAAVSKLVASALVEDAADTPPHEAAAPRGVGEEPAAAPPPAPDPAELQYLEARTAADEGRTAEAVVLYRQLLASWPRHLASRNNLALLLDAAGDHQAALTELDRALEIDPEHTTLLTNRGALLGALGRYAAAERDLRRVLRVEPANVEALFNLGVVMTKKGLWGEAVPQLRRATELASDRGAAFYYLGEALNHVDDLLGALAAYQRAAELQPENARALYGLGIIYDRLARPDDAAQMYRKSREVARH